jgi:glycosyltransferase involved in cell wall biosynthesis
LKVGHFVISSDVAGGQVVARELSLGAVRAGHEVVVFLPGPGSFADLLERDAIRTQQMRLGRAANAANIARIAMLTRHERLDILHTHALFAGNVAARVGGRLAGAAVVAHAHIEDRWRGSSTVSALQRRIDAGTAQLCARIIAVSSALRGELVAQGYPAARTVTIPNGISEPEAVTPAEATAVREELGLRADSIVLTSVARLCDVKGQLELIRATASLAERGAPVEALLVGEDLEAGGAYRRRLEAEAASLGVADRVVFAGFRGDIPTVLAASDIFVLPSTAEGMPISVIEAMAAAKPVLATAVGGVPEVVDDERTGILLPSREPAVLAEALESLIADPLRAARLGAAGRRRFEERFSAKTMVAAVLALYEEVRPLTGST